MQTSTEPSAAKPSSETATAGPVVARSRRPLGTAAVATGLVAMIALLAAALWWRADGGRWYVVETPSMGTTTPVGSLVLTTPVDLEDVAVGDVVTFHSPRSRTVYTHRVVEISAEGLTTRGDLNDAPDAGTVGRADVIGAVVRDAPLLGWVLKAVPILLVGAALTWLVSLPATGRRRRDVRLLGGSLTVAVANLLLHPWVGVQRMSEQVLDDGSGPLLDVVSTGVLPIRAEQVGGGATQAMRNGEVARLALAPRDSGAYDVVATVDLAWWGWALLALTCLAPLLLAVLLRPVAPAPSAGPVPPASAEQGRDVGSAILPRRPEDPVRAETSAVRECGP